MHITAPALGFLPTHILRQKPQAKGTNPREEQQSSRTLTLPWAPPGTQGTKVRNLALSCYPKEWG